MAPIDPDVNALLDALAAGGLTELARSAAGLATEVDDPDPERGARDGRASRTWQLTQASKVIVSRLEREIDTGRRMGELAVELGLKTVVILPDPPPERPDGRSEGPDGRSDDLLAQGRASAIEALLKSWGRAETALRKRWEAEGGD